MACVAATDRTVASPANVVLASGTAPGRSGRGPTPACRSAWATSRSNWPRPAGADLGLASTAASSSPGRPPRPHAQVRSGRAVVHGAADEVALQLVAELVLDDLLACCVPGPRVVIDCCPSKMLPDSRDTAMSYSPPSRSRTGISLSSTPQAGSLTSSTRGKLTPVLRVGSGVSDRAKGLPPTMAETIGRTSTGNMDGQTAWVIGPGGMAGAFQRDGTGSRRFACHLASAGIPPHAARPGNPSAVGRPGSATGCHGNRSAWHHGQYAAGRRPLSSLTGPAR